MSPSVEMIFWFLINTECGLSDRSYWVLKKIFLLPCNKVPFTCSGFSSWGLTILIKYVLSDEYNIFCFGGMITSITIFIYFTYFFTCHFDFECITLSLSKVCFPIFHFMSCLWHCSLLWLLARPSYTTIMVNITSILNIDDWELIWISRHLVRKIFL